MYTRNSRSTRDNPTQRYNPPPGYVGNTFPVKHHTPENTIEDNQPRGPYDDEKQPDGVLSGIDESSDDESGIRGESNPPDTNPLTCTGGSKNDNGIIENDSNNNESPREKSPLSELVDSLRGKIGTEELIILMVMLLISSDGLCAEVLILALCLIAG